MLSGNHRKWWGRSGMPLCFFTPPTYRIPSTQKKRKIRNEGMKVRIPITSECILWAWGVIQNIILKIKQRCLIPPMACPSRFFFDECHVGCPRISDFRPLAMSFNKMGDFVFPSRHMGSMFRASRAQCQNCRRRQKNITPFWKTSRLLPKGSM